MSTCWFTENTSWAANSRDFLMKHHILFNSALANDNMASFNHAVRWCLAVNRNTSLCDWCRFVQWLPHYIIIIQFGRQVIHTLCTVTCVAMEMQKNVYTETAQITLNKQTLLQRTCPHAQCTGHIQCNFTILFASAPQLWHTVVHVWLKIDLDWGFCQSPTQVV